MVAGGKEEPFDAAPLQERRERLRRLRARGSRRRSSCRSAPASPCACAIAIRRTSRGLVGHLPDGRALGEDDPQHRLRRRAGRLGAGGCENDEERDRRRIPVEKGSDGLVTDCYLAPLLLDSAADVQGLRHLRQEAVVREQPEPLHGGDPPTLQPEPPEGAHPPERRCQARLRLHPVPQGRQSPKSRSSRNLSRDPAPSKLAERGAGTPHGAVRPRAGSRSRPTRSRRSSATRPPSATASSAWPARG